MPSEKDYTKGKRAKILKSSKYELSLLFDKREFLRFFQHTHNKLIMISWKVNMVGEKRKFGPKEQNLFLVVKVSVQLQR